MLAIPRPIPTVAMTKMPTTITATTTSSSNSNTKLSNKLPIPKPMLHIPSNSPPDPNKPVINPITNRKSYDHITDRELRKKLKNRESAQAARDRKKAKMLALERQLSDMAERNKLLENENRELRGRIQRSMEGNAMAAMMNQGMHPSASIAAQHGMIPGQNMETPQHGTPAELHQIQNYQRQMQFLLEGNPAAAAAFHGQIPNPGNMAAQMGATQMEGTGNAGQKASPDTETIELAQINFPSLRLPTKGEPIDDDPFPDISSVGRHLSQQSGLESGLEVGSSGELDDYILRNFKGEASPVSGKTGSTGYSSAGCESPDAARSPDGPSPEFVASSWNNGHRSASSDSGHFSR